MRTAAARAELVAMARSIAERNLSHGSTGNVSIRHGDHVVLTPTGSSLSTVQADDLAVVRLDGTVVSEALPSKEAALHLAIYGARPDARAIAHTHSHYATALSCRNDVDPADALPALTAYYAMRVSALPLLDYHAPGDPELAEVVRAAAAGHPAMLLRHHGPVVAGHTPAAAISTIEEIEQTARIFFTLGGHAVTPLDDGERQRLFTRFQQRQPQRTTATEGSRP